MTPGGSVSLLLCKGCSEHGVQTPFSQVMISLQWGAPEEGLLAHVRALILISLGSSTLFSVVAAPVLIPTSGAQGFFLSTPFFFFFFSYRNLNLGPCKPSTT
jgi:hypothetical protein